MSTEQNTPDGLEITPELLLKAYACGVFPMAEDAEDPHLHWIEPHFRGILPLENFRLSRSLRKRIRQGGFTVRVDSDFDAVIDACAAPAHGRPKTWINEQIRSLYGALFASGHCHTVEVWRDADLIGGLYGVQIGAAFFGESMFHRETDASKIALAFLVARLNAGGFQLLDTQFVTEHLRSMGAIEVPRLAYREMLGNAVAAQADFYQLPMLSSCDDVLQLVNQMS